jgi:hypothetical protein
MSKITTTTKLLPIIAVIVVATALITLPYQNQVANAAPPGKKYQIYITLTGVPDNAGDLVLNGSLNRALASSFETIVSSPSDGQTLKFVLTLAPGTDLQSLIVTGYPAPKQLNPDIINIDLHTFTSKVNGPIRVDFAYPT